VVLAGGRGRRIGGANAVVELAGRPLIAYPLAAMAAALSDVAVIAKPDTELPMLPGITLWLEPIAPRHPLLGITEALRRAEGRPVLVCAADMPFVTTELIEQIAAAGSAGAAAAIAARDDDMQPLLGCYQPDAGRLLSSEGALDRPLRELVAAIHPRLVDVGDPAALFKITGPEDVARAEAILERRGATRM
jgi:molybdenum cofactor guanylyltransferase